MGSNTPTRCLLAVVAFGFCALASAGSWTSKHPHAHDCNPHSITQKEIPNFHYVDDDLYRGGHPSCSGLAKLESLGVHTFIDLGGAGGAFHQCKGVNVAGIEMIHFKISLADIVAFGVSDERLRTLFALMQKAPKPIFLSCSLGRDRTGVIVALYRMKRGEMSFGEAREEAIYYGYRPRFMGLRKALDRYRDPEELKVLPAPARTAPPPETVCRPKSLQMSARAF